MSCSRCCFAYSSGYCPIYRSNPGLPQHWVCHRMLTPTHLPHRSRRAASQRRLRDTRPGRPMQKSVRALGILPANCCPSTHIVVDVAILDRLPRLRVGHVCWCEGSKERRNSETDWQMRRLMIFETENGLTAAKHACTCNVYLPTRPQFVSLGHCYLCLHVAFYPPDYWKTCSRSHSTPRTQMV